MATEPKTARERFVEAMRRWFVGHYSVDGDNWYSCPKSPDGCADESRTECDCGQAEKLAAKEAACDAFADESCEAERDCPMGVAHESCRAAIRREVFGE